MIKTLKLVIITILLISLNLSFTCLSIANESNYNNNKKEQLILNKDIVEDPILQVKQSNINGYIYTGEFPPYRNDAIWFSDFSRPFVDYVPRNFHEALFFNNKQSFKEFIKRFKGILKEWSTEARDLNLTKDNEINNFFRKKIENYYSINYNYFSNIYPGLKERQYKLLMIMNLVHGNYNFNTQTKQTNNLLELIELEEADCSELGDLVASLAYLQGIEGNLLGFVWNYQTPIGKFMSGHRIFYADDLWIDPETNLAFLLNFSEFMNIQPEERLAYLIKSKSIFGFYNWYINPEIRKKQLMTGQDGGTIAFYYYYYFEGIDQGDTVILPHFPLVSINDNSFNIIGVNDEPNQVINVKSDNDNSINDFMLGNIISAKDYWEKELMLTLNNVNTINNYADINSDIGLLNSLASLIRYYGKQKDNVSLVKLESIISIAYKEIDEILSARDVMQGDIKGWGRLDEFDAFNDGSVNPPFTKYAFQTFEISHGILNIIDSINNYTNLSQKHKEKSMNYVRYIDEIVKSWEPRYKTVNGKGFYGYSQFEYDEKPVFNVVGSAISVQHKLYRLTRDLNSLKKSKELISFLVNFIKTDFSSGCYIWPYDLKSRRIDDVGHSRLTSKGILLSVNDGWLVNFEKFKMEKAINSFWSGDPSRPFMYISNNITRSNDVLAAGINYAQYYATFGIPDYLWEYARSSLVTDILNVDDLNISNVRKSLRLQLLGLLFEKQPQVNGNWSYILFDSDGDIINKSNRYLNMELSQSSGNIQLTIGLNNTSQPYFKILENEKIILKTTLEKEDEKKLCVSMTYRSRDNFNLLIYDNQGWEVEKKLIKTFDDKRGLEKWFRNSISVNLPKESKDLIIQVYGPVDIYDIKLLYSEDVETEY